MKKVLVIAPHDLNLDPRIKWMSESLSSRLYVLALGLKLEGKPEPTFLESVSFEQISESDSLSTFERLKLFVSLSPKRFLFIFFVAFLLGSFLIPLISLFFFVARWSVRNFRQDSSLRLYLKRAYNRILNCRAFAEIMFLYYLFKYFFRNLRQYVTFFKKSNLGSFDYILANDLDSLLPAIYFKKLFSPHAKIVYDAHEFYPFQFADKSRLVSNVLCFFEKMLLTHVSSMITVTPQLAKVITDFYKPSFIVHSIPNCAPFLPGPLKIKSESKKIIFLFQGIFSEGRGIDTLISFWSKLQNENLLLILRGPESPFKEYCRLLVQTGCENIKFADPVSEDDLIESASSAHVGIIPYEATSVNNTNCCPNKLSQYMQAGLAILATDLPFLKQVLEEGKCGLVYSSNSFESFARSVEVLSDIGARDKFSENGLSYVKNKFNWAIASEPVFKEIFEKNECTSCRMV